MNIPRHEPTIPFGHFWPCFNQHDCGACGLCGSKMEPIEDEI